MESELVAARHRQVLRHQERSRTHSRLRHPEQAAVELRHALEKHRRVPVHALLDAHGLHDRDVGLTQEQVREDERVRGALDDPSARGLRSVPALQRRDEVGDQRSRGAAEPLEGVLVSGRPVDLDMAVAPVAHDGLDGPLVPHHALVLRAHGAEQRTMDEAQMVAIAVVLGQRLPVGGAAMLHPAGRELDFAGGGQIAGTIDQPGGRAQMLGERAPVTAQAGEDESTIARHARRPRESVRTLVERRIATGIRHAEQLARYVIRPAVIRTAEGPRVAAIGGADQGSPVHAPVDEDGDGAVLAAHHDDGLRADVPGDEVARARDLAVVADEDPAAVEDPLQLVVEDARVGVERGVNAIVLHERLVVDRGGRRERRHRAYSSTSALPCPPAPLKRLSGRAPRARRTAPASPPP